MGALVVEAGQPIEDVAILLDVTTAEVKRARTAYNKRADVAADAAGETPTTADADDGGSHEN